MKTNTLPLSTTGKNRKSTGNRPAKSCDMNGRQRKAVTSDRRKGIGRDSRV